MSKTAATRSVDRDILRLAVPALGALIAEPLFLLADTAMVGHLGATPLAGLGLASAVLQTIIGLMVFLAYATTPAVARRLGAGDERGAVSSGRRRALAGARARRGARRSPGGAATPVAGRRVRRDGQRSPPRHPCTSRSRWPACPRCCVVFAATGLLRGLQDTRTPLWVAGIGFAVNIALNALFIYGLGWGIAGSAVGTVIAQWGMVVVYLVVDRAARGARRREPVAAPRRGAAAGRRSGGWLFLRTASLRVALLLATWAATSLGPDELAAYQVAITIYFTLGFALDALAIAAQALIGKGLGSGDVEQVRAVLRRCVQWGVGSGVVLGALVVATAWVLPVAVHVVARGRRAAAALARGARAVGAARRARVRARRRAHRRRRRAVPRVDRAREPRRVRAARARHGVVGGCRGPRRVRRSLALAHRRRSRSATSPRARSPCRCGRAARAWMVTGAPA